METERTIFVPMDEKYVDFYIENMNNPEIYRWLTSTPHIYTREEEIEWIRTNGQVNQFTIIEKETNEPIANAGYHEINGDIGELGIWVAIGRQNDHYGREIIEKLIEYGYQTLNLKAITLKVFENNERAIHLYKKIGFETINIEENITDGLGNPTRHVEMKLKERRN